MIINSSAFEDNSNLPVKYTCNGEGAIPHLEFIDIPDQAKSLVLFLEDPDSTIGNFIHWILYNIPPSVKSINQAQVPAGARSGLNSLDQSGYVAPCPPSGTHRYIFTLYALDAVIDIEGNPDKEIILKYMQGHILSSANITGLYGK